jgi:hypothetical protein
MYAIQSLMESKSSIVPLQKAEYDKFKAYKTRTAISK